MAHAIELPTHVPVLVVGGGPVGLTAAALLGRYGVPSLVAEADKSYCTGSRAICVSRRSLEILSWVDAAAKVVNRGLGWTGGRSYYRDQEVLHFQMPHDPTQRYAPMINIQQYYIEEYAHRAGQGAGEQSRPFIAWDAQVTDLVQDAQGATVQIRQGESIRTVRADWVVACDGGRSTVRERLGLTLSGMQYEGRYVIVDIRQKSTRPVERLAWFDPPSNPGSTLLMHRQPDDVWRIDYQIRDDEDPEEAVKPENVLPRVRSHLKMIGENEPWEPLWISIYNAKCLTLDKYRHGRVLFAGDAAHLVPIFGVRGLNSGLDDAANLAWKLARVQQKLADSTLLDTYSNERVLAARMNIDFGAKSTEFMAPPNYGFRLLREAALRLSREDEVIRPLINPRQSEPVFYAGSSLNEPDGAPLAGAQSQPGMPAPELSFAHGCGRTHVTELFGQRYVVLVFGDDQRAEQATATLIRQLAEADVQVVPIGAKQDLVCASGQQLENTYCPAHAGLYLIRPDGYIAGRWPIAQTHAVVTALTRHLSGVALHVPLGAPA